MPWQVGSACQGVGSFLPTEYVALIDKVPRGPRKILALIDVENMRSAQAIIDFRTLAPNARVVPAL
jgi:hypothetical protein